MLDVHSFRRNALLFVATTIVIGLGCKEGTFGLQDSLSVPGFQTFPSIRTFDGPGTIFRVAKDGTKYPATTLTVPVVPRGDETYPEIERTGTGDLDAALTFIGLPDSARATKRVAVTMHARIGPGTRFSTFDTAVDSALATTRIDWRSGSKYYLIRETIAVASLQFSATQTTSSEGTWAAVIGKLVRLGGKIAGQDSTSVSLDRAFNPIANVFYTAEEVLPPAPGMFTAPPARRPLHEPLRWRKEVQTP